MGAIERLNAKPKTEPNNGLIVTQEAVENKYEKIKKKVSQIGCKSICKKGIILRADQKEALFQAEVAKLKKRVKVLPKIAKNLKSLGMVTFLGGIIVGGIVACIFPIVGLAILAGVATAGALIAITGVMIGIFNPEAEVGAKLKLLDKVLEHRRQNKELL